MIIKIKNLINNYTQTFEGSSTKKSDLAIKVQVAGQTYYVNAFPKKTTYATGFGPTSNIKVGSNRYLCNFCYDNCNKTYSKC